MCVTHFASAASACIELYIEETDEVLEEWLQACTKKAQRPLQHIQLLQRVQALQQV